MTELGSFELASDSSAIQYSSAMQYLESNADTVSMVFDHKKSAHAATSAVTGLIQKWQCLYQRAPKTISV